MNVVKDLRDDEWDIIRTAALEVVQARQENSKGKKKKLQFVRQQADDADADSDDDSVMLVE